MRGEGFFNRGEVKSKGQRVPSRTGCRATCRLNETCKHPQMAGFGKGEKGILIIGEAVSAKEDARGEPQMGDATLLLRRVLKKYGVDLERDCRKVNAVACYPGVDKDKNPISPTGVHIDACRPLIWKEIKAMKPQLIFALGNAALECVFGHRFHEGLGGIKRWRGFQIPDRELDCWVVPTFHPSFVQKEAEWNPAVEVIFNGDIKNGLRKLDHGRPQFQNEDDRVRIISGTELKKNLYMWSRAELVHIAFDYETTGLKPHKPGHEIVTCSIADDSGMSYAFNWPTDRQSLHYFKMLMTNPTVKKYAANMKFEAMWTRHILGYEVEGWGWDTMQAAHVLDNRPRITGLKFQAFVQFGIPDYSSAITPYLRGIDEQDANSFNRIHECNREALLHYNGLDSLIEYKLAVQQINQVNNA